MATSIAGELLLVDSSNPVALFEGGLDDVLGKIEQEVRSHVADISTDKGRKAIASLAYKVAQSKTALDELGKNLVAEWKAKSAAVDAERRRLRERLDALKEEVRRPLTEWENAEKRRVEEHENLIRRIEHYGEKAAREWQTMPEAELRGLLSEVIAFGSRDWQEFKSRASGTRCSASQQIEEAISRRVKYDAEQAELVKLRAEAAERAKREREERIAKEAEEKAKREAEAKAERERQRVEAERRAADESARRDRERLEREKQEAIERAERNERERVEAEARAKRSAEQAAEAERQRVEREHAERQRKEQEANAAAAKRKAVRDAITEDIKEVVGCGHDYAEATMRAIVSGKIRYVQVVK